MKYCKCLTKCLFIDIYQEKCWFCICFSNIMILKSVFFFVNSKCTYAVHRSTDVHQNYACLPDIAIKKRTAVNHCKFTAVLIIMLHIIIQIHLPLHQSLLTKN